MYHDKGLSESATSIDAVDVLKAPGITRPPRGFGRVPRSETDPRIVLVVVTGKGHCNWQTPALGSLGCHSDAKIVHGILNNSTIDDAMREIQERGLLPTVA